ncbi:hypothetical protein JST97_27600 [bacterium]|nr:hypothetical protein [bacterium]
MSYLAWIPIVLILGLFGSLPFLVLRGLLYLALCGAFKVAGTPDSEQASHFSRRVAAVVCGLFSACMLLSWSEKLPLDGEICCVLTSALATCLVWMPASGKFAKRSEEDALGIRRLD